jgi:hypothetical protein
MSAKFAKTELNEVKRIDSQNVQVTVLSGPSKGKSYILFTSKYTGVGDCSCSWSKRNGTTCSHVRDAINFVAQEAEAAKPAKVEAKKSWLQEMMDDGELVFASQLK